MVIVEVYAKNCPVITYTFENNDRSASSVLDNIGYEIVTTQPFPKDLSVKGGASFCVRHEHRDYEGKECDFAIIYNE